MAMNRLKAKGRKEGGYYIPLPTDSFLDHPNFHSLSSSAIKLLMALCAQFTVHNNGDFSMAYSVLNKKGGWRSKQTLQAAKNELLEKGFIVETRKGGLNISCSLYGVTFLKLNDCKGKLDHNYPTNKPLGWWKVGKPP